MEPFDLALYAPQITSPAFIDQVVIDSRRVSSQRALFIALPGKETDGHSYVQQALQAGAAYAIVGLHYPPGPNLIHVPDTLNALQTIAHLYRIQRRTTVIGITGSSGKTLLKDLLQAILSQERATFASPGSFNSQVGVPLSLLQINDSHDLALIEAGISQPGEMDRLADLIAPDHAILTLISDNHIATLGSLEKTAQEKLKLAHKVPSTGWTLLPKALQSSLTCSTHYWDAPAPHLPQLTTWNQPDLRLACQILFPDQTSINLHTQSYSYVPNLFAMALSAAWLLGASSAHISHALETYQPELMRTELFQTQSGGWIINNPYCSDPQSLENSLRNFMRTPLAGKQTVLFGGLRQKDKAHDERFITQSLASAGIQLINATLNDTVPQIAYGDTLLIAGPRKTPLESVLETVEEGVPATTCFIDLSAVEHNLSIIKSRLKPDVSLMAVVKAVGYGTDARLMSTFLHSCGIDWLGVSLVDEGISLKRQGVSQKVFCLNVAPYEVRKAVKADLELGVDSLEIIRMLQAEAAVQSKAVHVHLHIDTGMSRFGCRPESAKILSEYIRACPNLVLNGVFSHYSSAEDPSQDAFTAIQNKRLENALHEIGDVPYVHISNSAGILRHNTPFNMVRIGLAMYGNHPPLRPALTLTSRIAGINECLAGDTVSYGRTHQLSHDARIAVIPVGYADGLHRRFEKSSLLIRGQSAPIVGHICMDYCMVDITPIPHARLGDPVLIFGTDEFGHHVPIQEFAKSGHSTVHELISTLGSRIRRVFTLD